MKYILMIIGACIVGFGVAMMIKNFREQKLATPWACVASLGVLLIYFGGK